MSELNLQQLKDLEYICKLAEDHVAEGYRWKSADEQQWLERIRLYRIRFQKEIATIECPHRWVTPEDSYTRCEICGALPHGQTPMNEP